ncbi:hypothetical protein [Nocardia sp. NPDC004711]
MPDRDLHHRSQNNLVLLGLTAHPKRHKTFEMTIQLTGRGLPYLQVPHRVLDLDRRRIRALVARHIDLAPVILDIPGRVGIIGLKFGDEFGRKLDQLRTACDSLTSQLLTVIAHRLGEPVGGVVGTEAETLDLMRPCRAIEANGRPPSPVLLLLRLGRNTERAHRLRYPTSHLLPP